MPQNNIIELIISSGITTKIILGILLVFSFNSWAIIFYKFRNFRKAGREDRQFLKLFRGNDNFSRLKREAAGFKNGHIPLMFLKVQERMYSPGEEKDRSPILNLKRVDRILQGVIDEETSKMEEHLGFLATTGNISPYIGLFGTVGGIIDAFQGISRQATASVSAVAPGIAEALVATAAGLIAAIPAVIAYNYFLNKIRKAGAEMESFSREFLLSLEDLIESERIN